MGTYIDYLKKFEKPVKKRGLTITVSGFSGSGKSTVAEVIAKAFKLKIFNAGDVLRRFASQKKISLSDASKIRPKEIDYQMDRMLLESAMKGGYVLVGRLSAWVAGDFADCKIFVNCQKKIRAKRVAKRDKMTLREALTKITQRDEYDQKQYKKLYNLDLKNRKIFDLTINNNRSGLQRLKKEIVKKVKQFLKRKYG
jgi:cytidylate kinase